MEKNRVKSAIHAGVIRNGSRWIVQTFLKKAIPRAAVVMSVSGSTFDYQAQFHDMSTKPVGPVVPIELIETLDISNMLPKNPRKSYPRRDSSDVTGYFVHHTGSPPQTPEVIANYHIKKRGWAGIGYHFAITKGKILILNDITVISNHTQGQNSANIAVVMIGNYETATLSEEDQHALEHLDDYLYNLGIKKMYWHRMTKATLCPGKNVITFLKTMERQTS